MSETNENKTTAEEEKLPEILYHYTTLEGFKGIIESGELWASNIKYLNDESEYIYAYDKAKDACHVLNIPWEQSIFDFTSQNTYIASFSKKDDDLSQWRAYAGRAGVCIGFEIADITPPNTILRTANGDIYTDISIQECNYSLHQQPAPQDLSFQVALATLNAIGTPYPNLYTLKSLSKILASYKNHKFMDESEKRLVIYKPLFDPRIMGFHTGLSSLIPHVKIPLNKQFESPRDTSFLKVKSVRIGPTPNKDLSKVAAEYLLKTYSYKNIVVSESSIPYRSYI